MSEAQLWVLAIVGTVWLITMAVLLWDLHRCEVRHLPRWGWALVIVLVSFPVGPILYLTLGRIPPGSAPVTDRLPAPPTPAIDMSPPRREAQRPTHPGLHTAPGPDARPVIATSGLTKRYGDTMALDEVDLSIPQGATYGLIGPNGAGKTTMLSILAGLRHATSGDLHLAVDRRRVAVLVDTPLFEPWLTAHEVVDLARHLVAPELGRDHVEAALATVALTESAHRRTGGFSRGMLQRLGLATCLVGDPDVLILDEPSSALDPAGRREVLDLLGRLGERTTVVISTHILADVQQVCDTVGVIDRGRLRFQGPIADLLARTSTVYLLHVRGPSDGLLHSLRNESWVDSVQELAPGRFRLVTDDGARAELAVPRLVAGRELALVSFNPATDLETAFLELTR